MKIFISRFCLSSIIAVLLIAGCERKKPDLVFPDLNPYHVSKFVIEPVDAQTLTFHKDAGHQWFVSNDNTFYADAHYIFDFLQTIADMRFAHCSEREKKSAPYKTCEATKITVWQDNTSFSFHITKAGEDYQSCYVKRDNMKECVLCRPYVITLLHSPLQRWIEKTVFDFSPEDIALVSLALRATPQMKWRLTPAGWKPDNDDTPHITADEIMSFYLFLTELKIHGTAEVENSVTDALGEGNISIEIQTKNGSSTIFTVGSHKNSQFFYASRSDKETGILLFSKSWMQKLVSKLSHFMPDEVLTKLREI